MKKFYSAVLVFILSMFILGGTAQAAIGKLDQRIRTANDVVNQIMQSPDQSIPEELLAKCKAVAIYPSTFKAAFIFGGRYGEGVVLKRDEKTGQWGPVAFTVIGGGNWGLQIGGQCTDLILVIMNERGLQSLMSNNVNLGADASVAAGPVGRDSSASTDLLMRASIITYSRSWGLFAGVSLDGALVVQDNRANAEYYGKPVTGTDILFSNAVEVAPSSRDLVNSLNDFSARWDKNPRPVNRDIKENMKYDYEGQITALYIPSSEIEVIDLRPMAERPKDQPASKRVKVDNVSLSGLKVGDKVKILFRDQGNEHRAQSIFKY